MSEVDFVGHAMEKFLISMYEKMNDLVNEISMANEANKGNYFNFSKIDGKNNLLIHISI